MSSGVRTSMRLFPLAFFNAAFHAGTTIVFREYSPGLFTSLVNAELWRRMTRAAMTERRLGRREVRLALLVSGTIHSAVIARQVFFVGVRQP
jgi:hypothetical protein